MAGLATAALHLWTEGPGPDAWGPWLKPWPVVCLALAVWSRSGPPADPSGRPSLRLQRLVILGLAVSALADVAIEASFLVGLVLFLLAHVAYIAGFVADERSPRLLRALPFAAYAVAMYRFLSPGLGPLAVPVGLYGSVIATMMWRAAARVRAGESAGWIALAGAVVFASSDTLLALSRFRAPVAWPAAIMVTYWAGQLGIAASAVRSR